MKRNLPGSYQRLDLFIKVLRVLCPNLTAAPKKRKKDGAAWRSTRHERLLPDNCLAVWIIVSALGAGFLSWHEKNKQLTAAWTGL